MRKRTSLILFWMLLSSVVVACGPPPPYVPAIVDLTMPSPEALMADAVLKSRARFIEALAPGLVVVAVEGARVQVSNAITGFDPEAEDALLAASALAYGDGRVEDGLTLFTHSTRDKTASTKIYLMHAQALLERGAFKAARGVAFDGLDRFEPHAELSALADRAIDEDTHLLPTPRQLVPDENVTAIMALGGGSTITLREIKDDVTLAAIKPEQDLGQSMYRSEIAFYRLCELLRCGFRVPYNEPIWIRKDDFQMLYARIDEPKQRGYRSKLTHIIWKDDPERGSYFDGVSKGWVPNFTNFVIEATGGWAYLLRAGNSLKFLDQPAPKWLLEQSQAAGEMGWKYHSRLKKNMKGMSARDVAWQLSDLISVDFLTNNWDRFSTTPEFYGANCHFEPGGFVAIDNGASFPEWQTNRVLRRLRKVQRFSRRFVNAVRRLEHDATLQRLFPNPDQSERFRFKIFWEQREAFLLYVDGLVQAHGADRVLVFE